LGDSLATSRKMKRIDLCWSRSITPVGWRGFSEGLTSPLCPLLELDISECEINDEGALAIASALTENTSLEKLVMAHNRNISSLGWIECFLIMWKNEIRLKQLDLSDNNINDYGATMLATTLVKMSSLESFSLTGMTSVSSFGWQEFADPRSLSKLRVLRLGKSHNTPPIDDSVIICFVDALIGNTSLIDFQFYGYELSEVGRRALANALCDKSSLVNTFLSNHTLQSIDYHRDLRPLLDMNECENKFEVARKKILATHFGDIDACVRTIFAPMPTPTLPTALSWIGRDRREYSMMYHVLHSMPWPLDSTAISSTE
jgi:Leucine-rich repeat (LRR) protein